MTDPNHSMFGRLGRLPLIRRFTSREGLAPTPLLTRAEGRALRGDIDGALSAYLDVVEQHPQVIGAWSRIFDLALNELGDADRAVSLMGRAREEISEDDQLDRIHRQFRNQARRFCSDSRALVSLLDRAGVPTA